MPKQLIILRRTAVNLIIIAAFLAYETPSTSEPKLEMYRLITSLDFKTGISYTI